MALYDVNFTLACPACFTIEANSKKQAMELAETELENMDNSQLLEYIESALDYMGAQILSIERAD